MGCSSPQGASLPNIPQQHLNRLLQVAQIGHPLNVNKKYEHLARIELGKQVNSGFRKTYAYHALTTREDLEEKRKEFWESRTSGKPAIWDVLRKSISAPTDDAGMEMLKANRIALLNGTIQMCLDAHNSKYEVPIFCINEPIAYSQHREDQNLLIEYEEKSLEITIRSTKFPNEDVKITDQSSTEIQIIKETLRAMKTIPDAARVRFFYSGRQMKDEKAIGNYGYVPGTVVQAMII